MPRVTEEHREAQRARIREAALAVARQRGIGGLGMNDVIRESGMSAGAIYGYYKGKEELVTELASELVQGRIADLEDVVSRSPLPHPVDVVRHLAAGAPHEIVEGGLVLEVWAGGARHEAFSDFARERIVDLTGRLGRYLSQWLEEQGHAPEDAARLGPQAAPALLALAQGYLVRTALEGEAGGRAYLDALDAFARIWTTRVPS